MIKIPDLFLNKVFEYLKNNMRYAFIIDLIFTFFFKFLQKTEFAASSINLIKSLGSA